MDLELFGGAIGIAAALFAFGLAVFVYASRPSRTENRILAVVLFLEGAEMGSGFGIYPLLRALAPESPLATLDGWGGVNMASAGGKVFLYLLLLAFLGGPLGRRLRGRGTTAFALVGAAAAFAFNGFVLVRYRNVELFTIAGRPVEALTGVAFVVIAAFYLYALTVVVAAYRAAPAASASRRQASAFALAFGLRDVVYATLLLSVAVGVGDAWPDFMLVYAIAHPLGSLVFCALLVYGFLYTQLFDIDLRVKWAIGKSTIAAIFLAVFFVVSEAAQQFFAESIGSVYVGIAAAGLLVFALAPLQRLADRVASAAMPDATASPYYLTRRKLDVYRAALEGALSDGEIRAKERDMLTRLQLELGIANAEARAMEAALGAREA